jgi:hypothetical protein
MVESKRLSKAIVTALEKSMILGIRAGTESHRFIGVWVVVVQGRVFIRSWNDKRTGWRETFRDDPHGVIQVPSGREVRVRARAVKGERLLDAVDAAYAAKYHTPASRKWVRGFARPRRRATTVELLPR